MVLKLFLILFPMTVMASVHNPGYYGEKDFDYFYATKPLIFNSDPYYGNIIFEENELYKSYIHELLSPTLFEYENFFNNHLKNSLSCPNVEMSNMYNYLRFTNRVIALSYIYESLRLQNETAQKLGIKNKCQFDWQKILDQCQTKSQDMLIFVKSAKHIVKDVSTFTVDVSHSIKAYIKDWERQYQNKTYKDISHYRIDKTCKKEPCNNRLDYKTAMDLMQQGCEDDTKLFVNICSEEDNLYGMSTIQEVYPLLTTSDILTYYNDKGHASGCLRRFTKQSKNREIENDVLKTIFPIVFQQLAKDKERFSQGDLFAAGSLKQFVEKGLSEIYREKKKIAKKVKIKKEKKVIYELPEDDKVEFIDRIVKKRIKKKKKKIVKKKKKKKEVKKSNFLMAVELQQQMDMDEVNVDMLKFKYDFLFSIELKKMLDENLEVYTTRKGLSQMKKFDNLGSAEGPMPLMFLKYLIETDKHQSLYNILGIIGDRFYVNNDIDRLANTEFDYIELKNDETTDYQWQINVLRIPEFVEEEEAPVVAQ